MPGLMPTTLQILVADCGFQRICGLKKEYVG